MTLGIDASRAFTKESTGTENYSFHILKNILKTDPLLNIKVYLRVEKDSQKFAEITEIAGRNVKFVTIPWKRFWTQGGLALELLRNPVDVLFIPAHTLPVIKYPWIKTVVTIHDLGYEYLPQYHKVPQKYYLNWSTVYASKVANRVIAVSEFTKKDLVKKLHCDIEKISVIYEGIHLPPVPTHRVQEKTESVFKKYDISKPYILSVGTVQPRKNYERLIEAFALLLKSNRLSMAEGKKMDLVIIGKKGWMYESILEKPTQLGIAHHVFFLEYTTDEELATFYTHAAVFCMPSLFEGFGLPILEAMQSGIPVAASRESSLPEVVGEAGLLFNPYDTSDIMEKLAQIITSRRTAADLIKKGEAQVKKFSWKVAAEETIRVINKTYSHQ